MNISFTGKRSSFQNEQEVADVRALLVDMTQDKAFHTESSYSANRELYPDNVMPFVDKHMLYLSTHTINTQHYISNLRLMTRIR